MEGAWLIARGHISVRDRPHTRADTHTHGSTTSPTQRPRSDAGRAGQRTHAYCTIDKPSPACVLGRRKGRAAQYKCSSDVPASHSLAAASSPIVGAAAAFPALDSARATRGTRRAHTDKSHHQSAWLSPLGTESSLPLTPTAPRLPTASAVQGRQRP